MIHALNKDLKPKLVSNLNERQHYVYVIESNDMLKDTGNIWDNSVIMEKEMLFHYNKESLVHIARGLLTEINIPQLSLNKIHASPHEKKRHAVLHTP